MAFNKDELKAAAEKAIEENQLYFMADVIAQLPCSVDTFYTYFKKGSEELDHLKELLAHNRVALKVKLRKRWSDSDNATLQIALFRLIADDDERRKLATNYNEHTGENGEPMKHSHSVEDHRVIFEKYKDA